MYLQATRFIVATLVTLIGAQVGAQAPMLGRADAMRVLTVSAVFHSHTSLRVSASELRFDITDPSSVPTVSIDFSAAARTYGNADVVLTVEAAGSIDARVGGRSADLAVGYRGDGDNAGTLSEAGPHVAGRWTGSGVRQGRVSFTLRGATVRGTYSLPLRFVLSAP
jgi:hypothetical protein